MQVQDIGSVVLLQVCLSFIGCITRLCAKDSDSLCVTCCVGHNHLKVIFRARRVRHRFLKVLYGGRPSDAVLSTRKHNDLLVFEQQVRILLA